MSLRDRQWHLRSLPAAAALASVVVPASLAVAAMSFVRGYTDHQTAVNEAAVRDFVRSFITQYTSPDPFNANAYADRILAQGTGDFAKMYREKMNEIVLQVARLEPGAGAVEEGAVGVERWNDDGSASVVAVASTLTTMPDGRKLQNVSRWVVNAIKEGERWKVSNLIQVI